MMTHAPHRERNRAQNISDQQITWTFYTIMLEFSVEPN